MGGDGSRTGGGEAASTPDTELGICWACGQGVSPRAFFCHRCGAIQPPASLDAFARLNLSPRFDIDPAALDRQLAGFRRVLDPARFEKRDAREKILAEAQRAALSAAHAELRDPVSRARLILAQAGLAWSEEAGDPFDWGGQLAAASDRVEVARIVGAVAREREAELRRLSGAFQAGRYDQAVASAQRLDTLRRLSETAERRLAELAGDE